MADLSRVDSANPTKAIESNFSTLMAIQDKEEFERVAIDICQAGFSEVNKRRFEQNLKRCGSLQKMQGYVTNFMLKGMGLGSI